MFQSSNFHFKHHVLLLLFVCFSGWSLGQFKVSGTITDAGTKEPLIGAAVVIKGKSSGVTADIEGKFELTIPGAPPAVLVFSFLGYQRQEVTVTEKDQVLNIALQPDQVLMKEVKIVGERVSKKLKESPVTIERLGIKEIKQTPAIGFYEGLSNLKGVDMTSASLGFKIINTRGFNSTSPVRTLQLIDGVDNQAPGLNFSLGNFVGASELDVERVDIIVGANSATYGPNAFNGVISMQTKDPYKYQGLNILLKKASRNLLEAGVRYAHVSQEMDEDKYKDGFWRAFSRFNNKVLKDRFAYKLNGYYLEANDWEAVNYGPTEFSNVQVANNANGYDAVNIYGESRFGNRTANFSFGLLPGTDSLFFAGSPLVNLKDTTISVYRTGYREEDLTNYNTFSRKIQGGVSYRIPEIGTLSYYVNHGEGTTVYQGDNRYSVKNIQFQQQKLELTGDNFFVRAYRTTEDAGDSYDLVFTATKLLENQKEDVFWYQDYITGYRRARNDSSFGVIKSLEFARQFADGPGRLGLGSYLKPGTAAFDSAFRAITTNPSFTTGGTRFADASRLEHVEFQQVFHPSELNPNFPEVLKIGGNYRRYDPNSNGTIFSDTAIVSDDLSQGFVDIFTEEYGAYINMEKQLKGDQIKFIGSLRFDDHQNFNSFFTPSASFILKPRETDRVRITYTQASRNPTLQDQYLLYDIGIAKLKGNISGTSLILPENYFGSEGYLATLDIEGNRLNIDPVKPEKVQTGEIGYKGIILGNLYMDASYYYSEYTNFLGYIVGFVIPDSNSVEGRPTRVAANANTKVTTQGFSLGLNYYFPKYFSVQGNYTFSELIKRDSDDPLIPFFNTPKHKYNIGITGQNLNNFGFNITYKWVDGFDYFGSPQFTGRIDPYGLLDAQVNYVLPDYHTTFKLGSSNILDNRHFEAFGAPLIGRLVYFSVNYEFLNTQK